MGWAYCGEDDDGRPIGYGVAATCDHPGCVAEIDRGLGYVCGPMHGSGNEWGCGRYYCGEHRDQVVHGCEGDPYDDGPLVRGRGGRWPAARTT